MQSEVKYIPRISTFPYILLVCATALLALSSPTFATDRYVRAAVDQDGQLQVVANDGRTIRFPKESEQVEFDKIAISQNGQSIGWLALYPNCCTSYPIPLKLVIFSEGKTHDFTGSGLPIWRWMFTAEDEQIAFEQETVHGGFGVHYELHDVNTGRLLGEYSPEIGPDNQPLPRQNVPKWVEELDARQ